MSSSDVIRSLGHFERYCVTRHNLGFASAVSILGTFETSSEALVSSLEPRLATLLNQYPHLSCYVVGSKTSEPGFAVRKEKLVPSQIISVQDDMAVSGQNKAERAAAILGKDLALMAKIDVEQDPLFRVAVYPSGDGKSCQASLTCHHVLSDGGGTHNLFEALFSSSPLPEKASGEGSIPSSIEATRTTKPALSYLVPVVFTELILPKLPRFISSWFIYPPIWPSGTDILKKPIQCERNLHVFFFDDPDFVSGLKKTGNKVGVKTIQGLIHAAGIVALHAAVTAVEKQKEVVLKTGTPMSARDAKDPQHGLYTGNFLANYEWTASFSDATLVWAKAKEFANGLTNPSTKQSALYAVGMLSLIPSSSSPPSSDDTKPNEYTSWETYFQEKLDSPSPFSVSLEISNIGTFSSEGLMHGARDLCWAQPAAPTGHAMSLNVLGTKGENESGTLGISMAWREGSLDEAVLDRFRGGFEKVLIMLKEGKAEITKQDVTFGQLRDLLQ